MWGEKIVIGERPQEPILGPWLGKLTVEKAEASTADKIAAGPRPNVRVQGRAGRLRPEPQEPSLMGKTRSAAPAPTRSTEMIYETASGGGPIPPQGLSVSGAARRRRMPPAPARRTATGNSVMQLMGYSLEELGSIFAMQGVRRPDHVSVSS